MSSSSVSSITIVTSLFIFVVATDLAKNLEIVNCFFESSQFSTERLRRFKSKDFFGGISLKSANSKYNLATYYKYKERLLKTA